MFIGPSQLGLWRSVRYPVTSALKSESLRHTTPRGARGPRLARDALGRQALAGAPAPHRGRIRDVRWMSGSRRVLIRYQFERIRANPRRPKPLFQAVLSLRRAISTRLGAGRSLVRIQSPRLREKQVIELKTAACSSRKKGPHGEQFLGELAKHGGCLPRWPAIKPGVGMGPSQISGPPERTALTNSSEVASARDYLVLCPEQIRPYKAIYSWCGRGSQSLRTGRRYATTGACRSRWRADEFRCAAQASCCRAS